MKFNAFLITAMALFGTTHAALPPLWQDVAELKSIFNDENLGKHLESGEAIVDIQRIDQGWMIVTTNNQLPIRIEYKESQMPGPAQFTIQYGKTQQRA